MCECSLLFRRKFELVFFGDVICSMISLFVGNVFYHPDSLQYPAQSTPHMT